MDKSEIEYLFHISESNKAYGTIDEKSKRRIQGSKGLGFLSVFKFGNDVTWRTIKDNEQRTFKVNYKEIIEMYNVSDLNIPIVKEETTDENGTTITIELSDEKVLTLIQYFEDDFNKNKIVYCFNDPNFKIELNVDGKMSSSSELVDITSILKDRQLFNVKYGNKSKKLEFYFNNILVYSEIYPISVLNVDIELDLMIFSLAAHSRKNVSSLFYAANNQLTPLVYINDNFFNNYNLFDPQILRAKSSGQSLPQMIGYINIKTADSKMQFNSDRTNFQENDFTDGIIDFLKKINEHIQIEGSKRKQHLVGLDILRKKSFDITFEEITDEVIKGNIYNDFSFKEDVTFVKSKKKITYSFAGRKAIATLMVKSKDEKVHPTILELSTEESDVYLNSDQVSLASYIVAARNSDDEDVKKEVKISVNGESKKVLESRTGEETVKVLFSYTDEKTGLISKELTINFISKPADTNKKSSTSNVVIPAMSKKPNPININLVVNKLVDQVNKYYIQDMNNELIASGIRSVIDLCIQQIVLSSKISNVHSGVNFIDSVKNTIKAVNTAHNRIEIEKTTGINKDTLKGLMLESDFEDMARKSHVGAHTSAMFLTKKDIENIGNKIGLFIMYTNEILNNSGLVF
jgi:hypothetical protein